LDASRRSDIAVVDVRHPVAAMTTARAAASAAVLVERGLDSRDDISQFSGIDEQVPVFVLAVSHVTSPANRRKSKRRARQI
jgi:hypothetical protein